MRLREPFSGYTLSSGHPLFHIAYLVGSKYAYHVVLGGKSDDPEQLDILWQLNMAHILVPVFNLVIMITDHYEYFTVSKMMVCFSMI
jgi:hypothetical protein